MFLRVLRRLARGNRVYDRLLCSAGNNEQIHLVEKIEEHDEKMLLVRWQDNSCSRFPYVYLRDLCTCSQCMNAKSLERLSDMVAQVPLDITASKVTISGNGEKIQIFWPDHHISEFDCNWLYSKKLLDKHQREKLYSSSSIAKKGVQFWDKKAMQDKFPRFDYHSIIHDDRSLFEWLFTLHRFGIALLHGVPQYTNPTAVEMLSKRVGFIKPTHYGNFFDVIVKPNANNVAFTSLGLALHCDLAYLEHYPGLQFLHCLEQTKIEGGVSYFTDGFHVAQEFKLNHSSLFDILSETTVPYFDVGSDDFFGDYHLRASQPVFELDVQTKKINRVTLNNPVRDCHTNCTAERSKLFYNAYTKLGMAMRDPSNTVYYKLKPGEMVTMNNSRVLHGRTGYIPSESVNRHLQGCYIDWDLVYSRLRALSHSLALPCDV